MAGTTTRQGPFLEREDDLARIDRLLVAARDGRGGVALIEGPAGIGKSSLLVEVREAAEGAGMRTLRARGAQLEHEFAFGVVRQLFEPALADAPGAERSALLSGAAGLAGRLLGLPGATDGPEAREAAPDSSFAVLHGLYWLCANLAAERPLCLLVDDAHWVDPPSLRYLAFLLPRLEELGVALLLAARPGEAGPGLALLEGIAGDPATRLLAPSPLGADSVRRLLSDGLGREPDGAFAAACHRATGGNPFLVGQLVQALAEDDVSPDAASAARVESLGARWAGRWILLRLGRLPPGTARLARALAILERGELTLAAELAGIDPDEAVRAADALVTAGILAPGRPLAFAHPIVRAGIYAEIGPAERARGHREAARGLAAAGAPDELVVEHLLAGEPAGDPWVVDRLAGAAEAATRSGAPESAAAYVRRALDEPPVLERRSELLLALGVAEGNAGMPEARAHMEEAIALAVDPRARVSAAVVLGHALARENRFVDALEVLDGAGRSGDGEAGELAVAAEALAVSIATFSVSTARTHAPRVRAARELADRDPSPTLEQLALAGQLAVRANEPAEIAAGLALRALAAGSGRMPEPTDLPWFHQCAVTLLWSERYDELHQVLDRAVAGAQATGDAGLFSGALGYRGWLAMRRGDPRAAEADTRTVLDAVDLPAPPMYRLRSLAVLVDALVEQGEVEEAGRLLAPAEADVAGDSIIAANLRVSRGRLRFAGRQVPEALADFLAAGEVARRTTFVCPSCLPWRSDAALAHLALGEPEAARALAGEELELARAFGAPRALGVALRAAGLAAGAADGEPLLRAAVDTLETSAAPLELARARTELGGLLRRSNRRVDARGELTQALDLAHRTGARALAARAETELRATGARPRRLMLTGVESLTASERRVAELAAQGGTNREIAQALFVTARTVEGHLTHVFQKLDLRSREDLAGALAAGS